MPLRQEFVAGTGNRDDQAWLFGVLPDLATQPGDQVVDAPIQGIGASAAYGVEQSVTRQHLARATHQRRQQCKFTPG